MATPPCSWIAAMACRSREPPVDRSRDTGGDHVKPRRGQLLPGNDQRALLRAIDACSELREPRRQQLVVVRDDDDVEPAAAGLASELPRRHAAVADERVHVEVGGEHELIAGPRRAADGHAIEHRARDHRHRQSAAVRATRANVMRPALR